MSHGIEIMWDGSSSKVSYLSFNPGVFREGGNPLRSFLAIVDAITFEIFEEFRACKKVVEINVMVFVFDVVRQLFHDIFS